MTVTFSVKESQPSGGGPGNYKNFATTQAEEDAFDFVKWRNVKKPRGIWSSTIYMVKSALGAGMLGGHVAYMKAGVWVGVPMNIIFGLYITYCLYLLVHCAHILNKRTRIATLTYADVGEAALACFPNPQLQKYAKAFRYCIEAILCIDLFGTCSCYQIIVAKTVKQLVENKLMIEVQGAGPEYPNLRVYLAAIFIPIILISLITNLKYLAPFSLAAYLLIMVCMFLAVYYAFHFNPRFENMVPSTNFYDFFEFMGITVFNMSCVGNVMSIENRMRNPNQFNIVLYLGMSCIVLFTLLISFFGYVAFLDQCESPITLNFPLALGPKILKGVIALKIYFLHAFSFRVPFNICFFYIKPRVIQSKLFYWEIVYRIVFVSLVTIVAITFPNIDALMAVLGTLCVSNVAFIWPNLIYLLVIWERPGLGKYKWRLCFCIVLAGIGFVLMVVGTLINLKELLKVFYK